MPMPDARIPRFQQRCPPHPRALHEAESQRRCSSMQSWPGRNPQGVVAALASNGRNCRREEHAGKERHLHRTTASTSAAASTQSLDTCSKRAVTKACVDAAVAQFIYATGTTFWVVVAISKWSCYVLRGWEFLWGALEGLEVPLRGSRWPGSASGGLWGPCGCKFFKCPKSYYTEQFEKYG